MSQATAELNGQTEEAAHVETVSHVVPLRVLLGVFAALIGLTGVTVAATWVDLGSLNLVVALAIATCKATLVALYFMHLRYDSPFYALLFATGLAFLTLFLGFTLLDAVAYQGDIQNYRQAAGM